jgi:GTP-binding protein EngB required for normal cell division
MLGPDRSMSDRLFRTNHERRLLTTFRYVDELVSEAVARLEAASTASSLSEYVPDAKPVQQKVAMDHLDRLRGLMHRFLDRHNIPVPERQVSALWAARSACLYASVSIEELRARSMRGFGDLRPEAEHELESLVAGLSDVLRRLGDYLAQAPDGDLPARIEKLEGPSRVTSLLRELDRIVTAQGLLEFRGSLEMLVERLESQSFEVAIFGRVSSGKSSLLNYLLGTDVLPIGVTPVTAVPIRIAFGPVSRAVIDFAEAKPIVIPTSDLAVYATEQENPSNARHVSRIRVELPSPLLSRGVTFVDTPGLGSLALDGARETTAYIPRCDAGIVLIDASSSLTADEIVLLDTLRGCGASVTALVTKADLLESIDRERMIDYTQGEIQRNLAMDVAVYPVSVKEPFTALTDRWLSETLTPQLHEHDTLKDLSIQRKIHGLQKSVRAALERRLSLGPAGRSNQASVVSQLDEAFSNALAAIDAERFRTTELRTHLKSLVTEVLNDAARSIVDSWHSPSEDQREISECVKRSLSETADRLAAMAADSLRELHKRATSTFATADELTGSVPQESEWFSRIAGLPIPTLVLSELGGPIQRPFARFFGKRAECSTVRRELERRVLPQLTDVLSRHANQLDEWRRQSIEELRTAFNARADLYRVKVQPSVAPWRGAEGGTDNMIEQDLKVLDAQSARDPRLSPTDRRGLPGGRG